MSISQDTRSDEIKSLYRALPITVGCLILWALVVAAALNLVGGQLSNYPSLINIAGKQRMLSQKSAFIAVSMHQTVNDTGFPNSAQSLNDTLNRLLNNQDFITKTINDKDLVDYYQHNNVAQNTVDYVDFLKRYSYQNDDINNGIDIEEVSARSEAILMILDAAVNEIQLHNDKTVADLLVVRIVLCILSIALLIYLYFSFIAKPLNRTMVASNLKNHAIMRFKRLFDSASEGLVVFDANWQIVHANESAMSLALVKNDGDSFKQFWNQDIGGKLKPQIIDEITIRGKWEGEIKTNKEGETCLSVSIIRINDVNDEVDFYGAVLRDITESKQRETKLHNLALYDSLTGLANRPNILTSIDLECESSCLTNRNFAILFIDVDGFKQVNDGYGHEVGDQLLTEVANRLTRQVNSSDLVARLGGDEFIILSKNFDNHSAIESLAKRILSSLRDPLSYAERSIQISASIGISLFPDDSDNSTGLIKRSDIAMYTAKQRGKNQFAFFNSNMEQHLKERFSFEEDLKYGLENNEFWQVFQPIINLQTGVIVGYEALLRWQSKNRKDVPPNSFIPMAESLNLMFDIDACVFEKSLEAIELLPANCYFSINLSPNHFSNTDSLAKFLVQLSLLAGEHNIIFEVTETAIIKDLEQSIRVIDMIRGAGYLIAIDDFGTGYTSFYNLKTLDFDIIKIDRSFVSDVLTDTHSQSIVKAIVNLALDLKIKVVAEGVENQAVSDYLLSLGCDFAQGYHYEKPKPLADFIRMQN
ncbi:EAL domain-containing protein [Marinomonas sp. 5E14-1]|uniref:EAL domain-containing protein n=1 Tax=Marinomonas sp. 5E14-1 TaxID=3153922 RepID=UPI0032650F8B